MKHSKRRLVAAGRIHGTTRILRTILPSAEAAS